MDNVVLFDGVCHLCSNTVTFVVEHESAPVLKFAPMQSAAGSRLMREFGFDPQDIKTFVLVEDGKPYLRSDAAIRIARYLRSPWKALGAVRVLPRPLRDWAYDVVARNRYRWFGRYDACMAPKPELRVRFMVE